MGFVCVNFLSFPFKLLCIYTSNCFVFFGTIKFLCVSPFFFSVPFLGCAFVNVAFHETLNLRNKFPNL